MSAYRMKLHCVPSDNVKHFWPDISGYIEQAAIKGPCHLSPQALKEFCEKGEMQLWLVERGSCFLCAAITDILKEPYKTVLEFVVVGGREMDQWMHFEREIADRAKWQAGATVARTVCRAGIMRKIEPRGYRVKGFIMERAL